MSDQNEESLFNSSLVARVKALREEKGWSAEQMATALGVPAERYRKYESRSPLPQYLIQRFALIVDRSVEFILTGKDKKPLPARFPAVHEKKRA
jgi:transcriptional regulator with XRE-family HTH domain